MNKFWFCIAVIFGGMGFATGQTPASNADDYIIGGVKVVAKPYDDKVAVRWAVTPSTIWTITRQSGFWVDRVILDENNKAQTTDWIRVNETPILPWTYEQFNEVATEDDDYLLIAAEALYGTPSVKVENDTDFGNIELASMEYENKYTLALLAADMDKRAAKALGWSYEDKIEVNSKYKYGYRVYPAEKLPPVFQIDTTFFLVPGIIKDEVYAPIGLETASRDKGVLLQLPDDKFFNRYTYYNVERSEDGKNFVQVNKKPVVFNTETEGETGDNKRYFTYLDSIPQNYKTYYYRINGVDAFGDKSYDSAIASGQGKQQGEPPSSYLSVQNKGNGTVELNWKQQEIAERPLKGFVIRRGRERDVLDEAIHNDILPKETRTFTDKVKDLDKGMYYQVISVDTTGRYSFSNIQYAFAYDSIPPAPPKGFKGEIDTLGTVKLHWKHDFSDNVYAYRLFFANNPEHTFSGVTADVIKDTLYVGKVDMKLLNEKVYYRIVAIDGNNNHSEFSEILELQRPRVIPPPAPVIKDYKVNAASVWFSWSSAEQKPTNYKIYRRPSGKEEWSLLETLPVEKEEYIDTTVESTAKYEYAVTVSLDNLESEKSFPLHLYVYATDVPPPIDVRLTKKDNKNVVSWKSPDTKADLNHFIIYQDTGSGFVSLDSVIPETTSYSKNNGSKVRYGVKAAYKNGQVSTLVPTDWIE